MFVGRSRYEGVEELPKVLGKPKVFIDVPAESQMCNFWLAVGT
jgi:hypothetical protein